MRPDLISVLRLILLLVKTPILFHNSNSTTSNEFVRQLAGQVANTTSLVNVNLPEGLQLAKEVQKIESHHLHLLSFTNDLKLINSTLTKIANEKTPLRFYMPFEPVTDANELARIVRNNFGRNSDLYLLRSENGSDYISKEPAWCYGMGMGTKLWLDTAYIFNETASRETNRERSLNLTYSDFLDDSKSGRITRTKAAEFEGCKHFISGQIDESIRDPNRVIPRQLKGQLGTSCGTDNLCVTGAKPNLKKLKLDEISIIIGSLSSLILSLSAYLLVHGCKGNRLIILCTTCLIIYSLTYLLCGHQSQHNSLIHILMRDLSLLLAVFRTLLIIKRLYQLKCRKWHRNFFIFIHILGAAIVYSLFTMSLMLHLQSLFNLTSSFQYPFLYDSMVLNFHEFVIYYCELFHPGISGKYSSGVITPPPFELDISLFGL